MLGDERAELLDTDRVLLRVAEAESDHDAIGTVLLQVPHQRRIVIMRGQGSTVTEQDLGSGAEHLPVAVPDRKDPSC